MLYLPACTAGKPGTQKGDTMHHLAFSILTTAMMFDGLIFAYARVKGWAL